MLSYVDYFGKRIFEIILHGKTIKWQTMQHNEFNLVRCGKTKDKYERFSNSGNFAKQTSNSNVCVLVNFCSIFDYVWLNFLDLRRKQELVCFVNKEIIQKNSEIFGSINKQTQLSLNKERKKKLKESLL